METLLFRTPVGTLGQRSTEMQMMHGSITFNTEGTRFSYYSEVAVTTDNGAYPQQCQYYFR